MNEEDVDNPPASSCHAQFPVADQQTLEKTQLKGKRNNIFYCTVYILCSTLHYIKQTCKNIRKTPTKQANVIRPYFSENEY